MCINKALFFITLIFFSTLGANDIQNDASKKKKIYHMGKNVYDKMCTPEMDLQNFHTIDALKDAIIKNNLCKPLQKQHFEALSLYLWEVKRVSGDAEAVHNIVVHKDEKCPICGMYVYKYPKWVAQIFYKNNHYSFDGMKDLMKYYFDNKEQIEKILVRDYYSQRTIDATKAYFVLGSDVYGPMGLELIAFEKESEAKSFYKDHLGKKILKFEEIDANEVYNLDE